jgi:hypothetical protein
VPGGTVSLQVGATDAHIGTLQYSVSGLPAGLSINSSGLIYGTIAWGTGNQGGGFVVDVAVDDGTLSSGMEFNWTVNPAIEIFPVADRVNTVSVR